MIALSIMLCAAALYAAIRIYKVAGWFSFTKYCFTMCILVMPLTGALMFQDNVNKPIAWVFFGPCLALGLVFVGILTYVSTRVSGHEEQYKEYLESKVNAMEIPDDETLLKYKEKAGYSRNLVDFEKMNDIQRGVAVFEWRKEMMHKLYNPFECIKLFDKHEEEEEETDE